MPTVDCGVKEKTLVPEPLTSEFERRSRAGVKGKLKLAVQYPGSFSAKSQVLLCKMDVGSLYVAFGLDGAAITLTSFKGIGVVLAMSKMAKPFCLL